MRRTMRAAAVSMLLLGAVTGWASAEKAAALPCADYLSSGINDTPAVGELVGTSTVTRQWEVSIAGITYQISETFEVGVYDFGGYQLQFNCKDYTLFQ